MTTNIIEIEGTWEQIAPQALRFPKRKMRLTILPENVADMPQEAQSALDEREETPVAPFRPTQFRNGVPLLPVRENAEPLTTEAVKRMQEELDEEEALDANRLAGR